MRRRILVGVDTGGTFTDFTAIWPDGTCRIHKCPSTPDDPARAVIGGLAELLGGERGAVEVTYGSTVATNAVLERKGARVAVVTTASFEDLLEIARQSRPDIYALAPRRPPPLVPRRRRIGIAERLAYDGTVLQPLTSGEVQRAADAVVRASAESVAICLLHAYANPAHEEMVAAALRARGVECSTSAELVAEYREYERLSTTVLNAYVAPVMRRHLARLADGVGSRPLRVLQSSGGAISVATAGREAVRTLLSGPAGGVVGAVASAARAGRTRLLTFDMGGTSTDVSLIDGEIRRHSAWAIGDLPVVVPAIDIHTVGAGGGSLARLDAGGALKVGPESAGADPGPACYGRGSCATVTDADVVLGRLPADARLGGMLAIDAARARSALQPLARRLRLDVEEVAEGIVRVVDAGMERALRAVSVQRGIDPRGFTLVAFGGAAGMHACALAEGLQMREVLVPLDPGVLSAWGATRAETERGLVRTLRLVEPSLAALRRHGDALRRRVLREVRGEADRGAAECRCRLDVRYLGQSYEVEVPLVADYRAAFHREHRRLYGHADESRPVEVVNVRAVAHIRRVAPALRTPSRRAAPAAPHRLWWRGAWRGARVLARQALPARGATAGPVVLTEPSATTLVPPGWSARVVRGGALLLEATR